MRNKDERDDIWTSHISDWWLTGYLAGFGLAATVVIIKLLGWLGSRYPTIAGFVVLGILTWTLIWLPRKAMNMPKRDCAEISMPNPADASALIPNDADLDTELRFLIIADEEQRRAGDDK